MTLGIRVATLLLGIFCLLTGSAAEWSSRNDVSLNALVSGSAEGLRILWKRRRGGGSDSDSDSDSSSSDYDYDVSSSSSGGGDSDGYHTCFVAKNVTREAHSDGYSDFYSVGNGKYVDHGYQPYISSALSKAGAS
ncbi:hypothetical protein BDW71DRAFT_130110 [Aspergillus fruticulosus]